MNTDIAFVNYVFQQMGYPPVQIMEPPLIARPLRPPVRRIQPRPIRGSRFRLSERRRRPIFGPRNRQQNSRRHRLRRRRRRALIGRIFRRRSITPNHIIGSN